MKANNSTSDGRQKLTATPKKIWKNEYFQTVLTIVLIVVVVFGFWYGSQVVLNTNYPVLAVVSGSMCIPYDGNCNGWDHPFAQTLHIGDLLIVQGVNPSSLNANYPNSNIIVFHEPGNPNELIVHRIVSETEIDGKLYFYTKGDGNVGISGYKWPSTPPAPTPEYGVDSFAPVSQDMVVGKVIMRIPWIGHIVLFMHDRLGVSIVILLVLLLAIIEFIIPLARRKKVPEGSEKD
jgi:signal peptidase I